MPGVTYLNGEHGVTFRFSDYIMPKAYYTALLPKLAAQSLRFKLHSDDIGSLGLAHVLIVDGELLAAG